MIIMQENKQENKAKDLEIFLDGQKVDSFSRDELIHLIANIYEHNEAMHGGRMAHMILCKGCADLAVKLQAWLGEMDKE